MKYLIQYAFSFLHQPYRWGGDDPSGFDCSGLVQEILASVNQDPPGDQTAHTLYTHFKCVDIYHKLKNSSRHSPGPGQLAFFGTAGKIKHVGFCIDRNRMIDASGGGPHVKTIDDAIKYNAFIRLSWIQRRKDLVACLRPQYQNLTLGG